MTTTLKKQKLGEKKRLITNMMSIRKRNRNQR